MGMKKERSFDLRLYGLNKVPKLLWGGKVPGHKWGILNWPSGVKEPVERLFGQAKTMFLRRDVDDTESAKRSEQGHVLLQVGLKCGGCNHSLIDVAKGDHRLLRGGRKVDWKLVNEVPIGRGRGLARTIDIRWKAIDFDAELGREIPNFLPSVAR
jgi:hypothetical protein